MEAHRQLPNRATGLHGVREWFLGGREYAHPALRWASTPLFRLTWAPFAVTSHSTTEAQCCSRYSQRLPVCR